MVFLASLKNFNVINEQNLIVLISSNTQITTQEFVKTQKVVEMTNVLNKIILILIIDDQIANLINIEF